MVRRVTLSSLVALALVATPGISSAQVTIADLASSLGLREIGPAVAGGRIADIAVHPTDRSTWYVAVGSGGLWKTTNAGTTWRPVFDDQPSYSIGTVQLDPTNPEVVWVGTGENVSGRHVAWGTGLYKSLDGGTTWSHVGLPSSEHIGRILVHPEDGNTVLVAAEGPLWSSGGERGVFRTEDGGRTWGQVLQIDDDTGVTDLEFDPSDPGTVYAAAYQRRRHIWGLMSGGQSSGIYKSTDGGRTWREVTTGLPSGPMGKIGLAVTPADPDLVYATIEAPQEDRGFYRSRDKGESWTKRNTYISGGTGPHYYQEIEASPTEPDLVIQMDVFFQITRDGGATFDNLGTGREKHSDNHALWIDPDNTLHMLAGTDAGLYETFDRGATWRHFPNMPISQFYKVAVSNNEPFYEILGGAQDLGTLWGPARTMSVEGVRNEDWYFPMGADGYGVQIDPTDPDILYLMTQQGNLYRTDRRSEESIQIQPQPAPGDPPERWNWDSPVMISPHDSDRLYFASQRLWRSDDRGDSWTVVSGDLTTDTDRYELPYMGRVWSVDAMHDNGAMSQYATLTTISESPLTEGLLYTGSDDGLIHVSADGGESWRRASPLPGVPERAFMNKVEADLHEAASLFALADAHKVGDYTPYLFESRDNGQSWTSIRGDLRDSTIVWAIQQDHIVPDLLFIATEYGLHASANRGVNWHELPAGVPTIAFRDLKIHRRDDDLIGATFGRGFYILDDYGPLRAAARGAVADAGGMMPVRDAWWYVPHPTNQARGRPTLGSTAYAAPNPDFGATFTYAVTDVPQTRRKARESSEAALASQGADVPFPGYDALRAEAGESGPKVLLQVSDETGRPVRWLEGTATPGVHRVAWDLRRPAPNPVNLGEPSFRPPWVTEPVGPLAPPGSYAVRMVLVTGEEVREVGESQRFNVKPVATLPQGTDLVAVAAFQERTSELFRRVGAANGEIGRIRERIRFMRAALMRAPRAQASLFGRIDELGRSLDELSLRLQEDPVRGSLNVSSAPGVSGRIGNVIGGHWSTRQTPTATQQRNIEIAEGDLLSLEADLTRLIEGELVAIEAALEEAGAPWTPGRR
ncbi:MAG: glycosyl hydrolase [Gemmatimonadota bacterium]|nr:glycosyl hydrolase [Gemmatimonadota bacterium]